MCDECWNPETDSKLSPYCSTCGAGYKEFFGANCVREFGDYIFKSTIDHLSIAKRAEDIKSKAYVFAHNSKGYDGHFIMRDLFERGLDKPEIVMIGNKVLKIDIGNVRFLDSLSFFQQPLSELPKSFGFEDKVVKGFFPHLFNTEEHYDHEGEIPDQKYFGIDFMKPNVAKVFINWYNAEKAKQANDPTYKYNFKTELIKYCKNDVEILKMAIMKFRELFIEVTEIDPFTRNFTLPSVGLEYFRANMSEDKPIGITPLNNYIEKRNNSIKANTWLDWHQKEKKTEIIREHQYGPFFADGYIKDERHVFEFFGCYFHGCPICYPTDRDVIRPHLNNMCYDQIWRKTIEKVIKYIKNFIILIYHFL